MLNNSRSYCFSLSKVKVARLALLLSIGLIVAGCGQSLPENQQPNIVLLFADDLGYGDLSSYGHPTIRTPNLDQMAREGIRLTSFYAQTWCVPSRAALLTGRYPIRVELGGGTGAGGTGGLPASEVTLAEALGEEGYRTMMIGKWHLGYAQDKFLPTENGGFDSWFGLPYSNDYKRPWVQTDVPLQLYRGTEPVEYPVDQTTLTTRYTQEALKLIEESAGEGPFFLYLAYAMPHLPLHTTEQFKGQSRAGLYGDVVETIDWSVGQVLEALEEQGIAENTLVIFTSDNGPWMDLPDRMLQAGNKPWHAGSPGLLRGWKGTTYEGGVRVPAIIRWPGVIPPGQVSADMATTMDLYVTFIEAAGGQVPDERLIDGHNIMPFLRGNSNSPTDTYFYFDGGRLWGVRQGPWKLHLASQRWSNAEAPVENRTWQLFHVGRDPSEHYDVSDEHPELVKRLKEKIKRFADEVGAEVRKLNQ